MITRGDASGHGYAKAVFFYHLGLTLFLDLGLNAGLISSKIGADAGFDMGSPTKMQED